MDKLSDEALVTLVGHGNRDAFAMLVSRHLTRYYRVAYRVTGNRADAEDVVQDALTKLWMDPKAWDEGRKVRFTTWFYRVVVNRCLDHKRKTRRIAGEVDENLPHDGTPADTLIAAKQKSASLERALGRLPDRQRAAVVMCYFDGMSNQEAAEVMQLNLKAFQSLLVRARQTLRQNMGEVAE